jgi:hypothetical protein
MNEHERIEALEMSKVHMLSVVGILSEVLLMLQCVMWSMLLQ